MHEATIAMAVIQQVTEAARAHRAARVTGIELEVGVLRGIVPEAMQLAFEACAIGTPVEGARLVLHEVHVSAHCRCCERSFEPDLQALSFTCPGCGRADYDLTGGNEVILKSIECQQPQEADRA